VVFHDETLSRMSRDGDGRAVAAVRFSELPRLSGGERVPRLDEALSLLRGRLVNVEVKADVEPTRLFGELPARARLLRAVASAVRRAGDVEVRFSSFDPLAVLGLAALLPRVPRAILVGQRTPRAASALPLALRRVVTAAHLDEALVTAARVERLARAELGVAAWTVNDPLRARRLVAVGVRWLITDSPGRMVAALRPGR
jgi:glycerophosphoryl diester phosphodiesterase